MGRKRINGTCTEPGCGLPAVSRGLCHGHRRQREAGQELRPLRGGEPLVVVALRVPEAVKEALRGRQEEARATLEELAKKARET